MPNEARAVEVTVDIAAPADAVWSALTDPAELIRWFPSQAAVTPGVGGTVQWSWDDLWTWESTIDLWQPGHRLRLVQEAQRPFDVDGGLLPEGSVANAHMVMDFTLETVAGRTRLQLVHSGFGRGAAWDDELDGVRVGWNQELRGLAFYLERHRGRARHTAWARLTWPDSQEATWRRLLSSDAFALSHASVTVGAPYSVEVSTGDRFDGIVQHYTPNRDFSGTARAFDDGILRIGTHRADGRTGIHVSLASYDSSHASEVVAFGQRAQALLERLFAAAR